MEDSTSDEKWDFLTGRTKLPRPKPAVGDTPDTVSEPQDMHQMTSRELVHHDTSVPAAGRDATRAMPRGAPGKSVGNVSLENPGTPNEIAGAIGGVAPPDNTAETHGRLASLLHALASKVRT